MELLNYKMMIDELNYSIAEHELIYDKNNNPIDYKYTYVNKEFCNSLNVSEKEVIGRRVFDLFPETEQFWLEEYSKVVRTGESKDFVHYSVQFDRYFSVFSFKTRENHFMVSFSDVTEYVKRSMENPTDSKLLRTFRTSSKAAFFEFDIRKRKFNYSDNLEDIVGQTNIKFTDYLRKFVRLTHPSDFKKVADMNQRILSGQMDETTIELRFYNEEKDEYVWLSFFLYVTDYLKNIPINVKGIVRDITTEKRTELDLEESNKIFKETRKIANIATFLYFPNTDTFEFSEELNEFLGVKELVNIDSFREIVHKDDLKFFDAATDHIIDNPSGGSIYRIWKNNEIKYIQSALFSIKNDKGVTDKVSGILKDITYEEINRQTLDNSRKSFHQIFSSSPAGIFILNDDFEITMRNDKFLEFTNNALESTQAFLGSKYLSTINTLREQGYIDDFDIEYYLGNDLRYYRVTITTMVRGLDNRYQGTVTDITENVKQTERIKFLATKDVLTNLYNRNYFEEQVATFNGPNIGVINCDIDGLKLINDAFGHLEGDKLLVQFAAHLNKEFENEVIARMGGDEFTIVAFDKTMDEIEEYEKRIKSYVDDLFMFGISIDVSIGYSVTSDTVDFREAFIKAENMMYRRKLTERSSRKSNALNTIMQTLHEKTHETEEHCVRVGIAAAELLKRTGRKRNYEIEEIKLISSVHDIGKIAVPEHILRKIEPLTNKEFDQIKTHCESGYKIVSNIINNDEIAIAVLYHHERWDGTGYPHNLQGEDIPLYARVVSIADAFDTMVQGRVYQEKISEEDAKKELLRCAGTQFDPDLVNLFIEYLDSKK